MVKSQVISGVVGGADRDGGVGLELSGVRPQASSARTSPPQTALYRADALYREDVSWNTASELSFGPLGTVDFKREFGWQVGSIVTGESGWNGPEECQSHPDEYL